jgi:hypothetical protein
MIMLIVSLVFIASLFFMSWRLFVGRSRLVIGSDKVHFPTVSGYNLARQEFEFPRDFEGDLNLLFVAFLRRHQLIINTWLPFAQELEFSNPGLVYYELPTIDEMPVLSRTFINEGMRAGIPDPKARQRTVTLYIDTDSFMEATEIPNKNDVHILLVNRDGEILWRTTGDFEEGKGADLLKAIESIK